MSTDDLLLLSLRKCFRTNPQQFPEIPDYNCERPLFGQTKLPWDGGHYATTGMWRDMRFYKFSTDSEKFVLALGRVGI